MAGRENTHAVFTIHRGWIVVAQLPQVYLFSSYIKGNTKEEQESRCEKKDIHIFITRPLNRIVSARIYLELKRQRILKAQNTRG